MTDWVWDEEGKVYITPIRARMQRESKELRSQALFERSQGNEDDADTMLSLAERLDDQWIGEEMRSGEHHVFELARLALMRFFDRAADDRAEALTRLTQHLATAPCELLQFRRLQIMSQLQTEFISANARLAVWANFRGRLISDGRPQTLRRLLYAHREAVRECEKYLDQLLVPHFSTTERVAHTFDELQGAQLRLLLRNELNDPMFVYAASVVREGSVIFDIESRENSRGYWANKECPDLKVELVDCPTEVEAMNRFSQAGSTHSVAYTHWEEKRG